MTTIFMNFLKLINMSITAGWIVIAVMLLRLLLKKMPKQFTCMLWGFVGFRLVFPFSIESVFSLIPSAETIPTSLRAGELPEISSGIATVDRMINPAAKISFSRISTGMSGTEAMVIILHTAVYVWLAGMFVMFFYLISSYFRLRARMQTAVLLQDNIWQSDFVTSPFILGLIKPRIYIPFHLDKEALSHVLAHENAHISRKDHLVKAFAFCLLSIYWFHPLLWAAYILLCRDIELACDERVLRNYTDEAKKSYLLSLIGYEKRECTGKILSPLAFGEVDLKERITRAKTWKRPVPALILAAVLLCAAAAFCLLTDPKEKLLPADPINSADTLYSWRTKYIGDNSAVGNIIYNLNFPEDMTYKQFALQTDSEPYEVTITFTMSEKDKEAYGAEAPDRLQEINLLRKNACILFSLVENAGIVHFRLVDKMDEEKRPLTFVYTRQWAVSETGFHLWKESETKEEFEALLINLEKKFSPTHSQSASQ